MGNDLSYDYDALLSHKELCLKDDKEIHCLLYMLFPNRSISSHSTDWRKDKKYILKAKGGKGDVIVGWLENFKFRSATSCG